MSDRHKHGSAIGWMFLIGIPLCIVFWAWVASADTYPLKRNDRGGLVLEYIRRVEAHNAAGDRVELRMRRCLSSCTLLLAVNDVCVSPSTRFGFHGTTIRGKMDDRTDRADMLMVGMYPLALGKWYLFNAAGKRRVTYLTGAELIRGYGFTDC